jgi:hypothetical protein
MQIAVQVVFGEPTKRGNGGITASAPGQHLTRFFSQPRPSGGTRIVFFDAANFRLNEANALFQSHQVVASRSNGQNTNDFPSFQFVNEERQDPDGRVLSDPLVVEDYSQPRANFHGTIG